MRRYTAYYNDNFIFRDTLVHSHLLFKFRCFGVSAVPKVIIGKEGWLFMGKENKTPGSAGYFSSIQPFTRLQLEQWRVALEERQKWLANRGIFYLFIPTPDKSIIYPEYLPDSLRPFYRRSRVDQLVQYLEKHSSVPVVKLKDALLAGKKENRLYFKTDSHWNDYGACIAYGEIMKRVDAIFKTAGPTAAKSVADFRIKKRKKKKGGNLAVMLSMQDSFFAEERFIFRPREPFRYKRADFSQEGISRSVKAAVTEYAGAGFRGAVMLHDSFGRKLKPFLSEHFSR
ncbi:MAG: hypothetical protein GY757_59860, partial [bacterium]|nr:hypothetical protein [bacterium]